MKKEDNMEDALRDYKEEIRESIDNVQKRIKAEKEGRNYIEYFDYPAGKLKHELSLVLQQALGLQEDQVVELITPPSHVSGDFALEIFDLAKKLGEKPNILTKRIVEYINSHETFLIKEASAVDAFVNVEIHKEKFYQDVIVKIIELGEHYGECDVNAGKLAIIDYSAPNIAKPIGVGHLRSTIIGQALSNIYHETGYGIVKDNHLGDWGTQFGSLIYAYKMWGDEKKIEENPIGELKDLYVKFHQFAEEHPEIKDNARELFAKLEQKDPELIALWKRFRDLSLKDFGRVYDRLGIKFDTYIGESYFIDQANKVVEDCLIKGFCKKDEASETVVVDKTNDTPSFLLRKQDGSTLYLTRDLATLQFRINTFNPDTILYVVGSEQDLNFRQLFGFGKRVGYLPDSVKAKHIGFGMVLSEGRKMSTRKGTLIELEDLILQATEKSKKILLQKNPDIDFRELEKISEIIGVGAILYNDLRQSRNKNISFDWDKMLDLEGGSAVYLQYSYVRINSILKRLNEVFGEIDLSVLGKGEIAFTNNSEFNLAKKLMIFPEILLKAQQTDSPHLICGYLEELAQLFNSFYNEVSVIKTEDQKIRDSRVALIKSVSIVIKKGLALLNINVPDKM